MVKDTTKYVREYLQCQKERSNRQLSLKQEIDKLKEI